MANELYITLTIDIEYGIEIVDEKLIEMFHRTPLLLRSNIEDDPNLRNNFRRFFRVSRNSLKLDKQLLHIRKKYETLLKQSNDLIDYELNFNTQFEGTNIYVVEFQPRRDLVTRLLPLSSDKNRENIDDITFYFAKKNNLHQLRKLTEHNFNLFNLEITGSKYSDPTFSELIRLKKLPKDDLFREYNPGMPAMKVKLKFKIPIREVVPSTVQKAQTQSLLSLPEKFSSNDDPRSHRVDDDLGDREHPGRASRATASISARKVSPLVPVRSMEDIASTPRADMRFYSLYDHLVSGGKKKNRTKTKTKTKTRRRPTKTRKRKRKRKRNTKRR